MKKMKTKINYKGISTIFSTLMIVTIFLTIIGLTYIFTSFQQTSTQISTLTDKDKFYAERQKEYDVLQTKFAFIEGEYCDEQQCIYVIKYPNGNQCNFRFDKQIGNLYTLTLKKMYSLNQSECFK